MHPRRLLPLCAVVMFLAVHQLVAVMAQPQTNLPTFSVKNYGAAGDGKQDDTKAIQAAINAAGVAGGEVLVPAGKYFLTSSLNIAANHVSLKGAGFSTQLFFENRAGIPTGIIVNQSTDVDISNLRVTGSAIPTLSRGIYISFSNQVRVHNVWQAGASYRPAVGPLAGIGTTESSQVWITDCD